jgi:hypothetical protein
VRSLLCLLCFVVWEGSSKSSKKQRTFTIVRARKVVGDPCPVCWRNSDRCSVGSNPPVGLLSPASHLPRTCVPQDNEIPVLRSAVNSFHEHHRSRPRLVECDAAQN